MPGKMQPAKVEKGQMDACQFDLIMNGTHRQLGKEVENFCLPRFSDFPFPIAILLIGSSALVVYLCSLYAFSFYPHFIGLSLIKYTQRGAPKSFIIFIRLAF